MSKERALAEKILEVFGGKDNIAAAAYCMTRLRLTPVDDAKVDKLALKKISGVMGLVEQGGQLQIVIGPGIVTKVANEVTAMTGFRMGEVKDLQSTFADMKKKPSAFKHFLHQLANIFVPLIPAIIASGLISGLTATGIKSGLFPAAEWVKILQVLGSALFTYLGILVGINAAREFRGTPAMGGLAGAIMIFPDIAKITLFGAPLVPGRGGLLGVLLVVWFMCLIERSIRKHMPNALDIILTPPLTVIVTGFATYFILQPVGGYLSDGIVWFFNALTNLSTTFGASGSVFGYVIDALAGAILAGTFLPIVMTGLHQGLAAIHTELIKQSGATALLPILAMGGAGQVGAVVAVYMKSKNPRIKELIRGALPAGFLGIGEPLIYGVTLPMGKPFVTACCGAAVGGAWQCMMHTASVGLGISGLPLALLIQQGSVLNYLMGVIIAYIAGFLITSAVGFDDSLED